MASRKHTKRRTRLDWDTQAEREFWRYTCRESFWQFALVACGIEKNPRRHRWLDDGIHRPLADWYEYHVRAWERDRVTKAGNMQRHLAVVVPREVGKTTLITQAGQLWLHVRDREISTYTGSEKTDFAIDILSSIKSVIDGTDPYAQFTQLYGKWYQPDRTWKTDQIVHSARKNVARKEPSMGTWGVESGLTGKHPDALFLDDPTSYEKLISHRNWLDIVNRHIVSLIPVLSSDGLVIWIGTRYDDEDHFGKAFKVEGVASVAGMKIPGIKPVTGGKWHVYFLQGRDQAGTPMITRVWPESRLKDYERKDPLRYAAQIMNDPSSSEFTPITRSQIDELWVEEQDVPLAALRYSIHIDTAFKTLENQARGDESVIQVWGHTRDRSGDVYFIEGHGSNLWRIEDFANQLVALCQRYKKQGKRIFVLTDEDPAGAKRGAYELVLQSFFHGAGIPMPPLLMIKRGGKNKYQRMIESSSFWVDGHVRLIRTAPGVQRLVEQMLKITPHQNRADDWADAAADVFAEGVYHPMGRIETKVDDPWKYIQPDKPAIDSYFEERESQEVARSPIR